MTCDFWRKARRRAAAAARLSLHSLSGIGKEVDEGGPFGRPARLRMAACPACGEVEGFIEVLTRCTVVRRVDSEFEHVELIDWDPTPETQSTYKCVRCGARFSAEDLEAQ